MNQVQHIVVAGVLLYEEKVLIIRRSLADSNPGSWEIPRGKLEFNESIEQALQREYLEETGISITVKDFITSYSYDYHAGNEHRHVIELEFFVVLAKNARIEDLRLSPEHDEWQLVTKDELRRLEPMFADRKTTLLNFMP